MKKNRKKLNLLKSKYKNLSQAKFIYIKGGNSNYVLTDSDGNNHWNTGIYSGD